MPDISVHGDVRWNPDLTEWFCARCGQTSDHVSHEDAVREMAAFECRLVGARTERTIKSAETNFVE